MDKIRQYWVDVMLKIASPVLEHTAQGTLRAKMPVETNGNQNERIHFMHLEALGRTLCGIAPWLETPKLNTEEEALRKKYASLARQALANAVNPQSPDYMNFTSIHGDQPLVDGAFLAHALLRAPTELYQKLSPCTQLQLAAALKSLRSCTAYFCNWLLFAAMVETALCMMGEEYDMMRIDYALRQHEQWYKGDGLYGDGPDFHLDYYNSFVIQPMMVDIITFVDSKTAGRWACLESAILARAKRYAAILERLIMPDGSFPAVGRSLCYRFGCFQHLAQMALQHRLAEALSAASVRCALSAVIQKMLSYPDMFDQNGWLTIGFCGHQPDIAEQYISTGSVYLCESVFLPLGLEESDPFWSEPDEDWTSVRIWKGENVAADHHF